MMLWLRTLHLGVKSLLLHPMRSLLTVLGIFIGAVRTTPIRWAVRLGNLHVEVFRNVPLLVQMLLWYFVLPELLPQSWGDAIKQMPDSPPPNAGTQGD
jgi:His/Glu/Gln/Arg/opine family amino acid ABC transporter permease subunit